MEDAVPQSGFVREVHIVICNNEREGYGVLYEHAARLHERRRLAVSQTLAYAEVVL